MRKLSYNSETFYLKIIPLIFLFFLCAFINAQKKEFWLIDVQTNKKTLAIDSLAATKFLDSLSQNNYFLTELENVKKEGYKIKEQTARYLLSTTGTDMENLEKELEKLFCYCMGKEQIEVPFEGKMYYGCCNMCKEKIPKDQSVRYAVDPHSLKKISKADAYIVVIGDNDEVAYFENEQNYQLFLNENAL